MKRHLIELILGALAVSACVYPFEADIQDVEQHLVVEGDIEIGGTSSFTLSYMQSMNEKDISSVRYPSDAILWVETENAGSLKATRSGKSHVVNTTGLNPSARHRIHVTMGGKNYYSQWAEPQEACSFDDLSWSADEDKVNLIISAHGVQGSGNYRYDFKETWEYHAIFWANAYFDRMNFAEDHPDGGPTLFTNGENTYYCWDSSSSKGLQLISTEELTDNRFDKHVFMSIPRDDLRLCAAYRIDVGIYEVSAAQYQYYDHLKEVSSYDGSLFAPTPSEMRGNLYCEEVPEELVPGYVGVVRKVTKRLEIIESKAALFTGKFEAPKSDINDDTEKPWFDDPSKWYQHYRNGWEVRSYHPLQGTTWARKYCVDCRIAGGTKTKPADWPTDHI